MRKTASSLRLGAALAALLVLHFFGVYRTRLGPGVMLVLTLALVGFASVAFLLSLRRLEPMPLPVGKQEPGTAFRLATCGFVALAASFWPGSLAVKTWLAGWPLFLLAAIVAMVTWLTFKKTALFLAFISLTAFACRAGTALAHPLDPARSDMVPLLHLSITRLILGQNPYAEYLMPWSLPLTYLPILWVAFLPAWLLGLDLRWVPVSLGVAAVIVIWHAQAASQRKVGLAARKFLLALLLLSSLDLNFSGITPEPVFWLGLSMFIFLLARREWLLASLAMGLCLAARQQAALLVPFYIIFLWRRKETPILPQLALLLAVPALLCLPFLLASPTLFLHGVYLRFGPFALQKWLNCRTWEEALSFAPLFFQHSQQRWLVLTLLVIELLFILVAARRLRNFRDLVAFMGLAFLWFLVLSPIIWPYMYSPLAILIFASLFAERHGGPGALEGQR